MKDIAVSDPCRSLLADIAIEHCCKLGLSLAVGRPASLEGELARLLRKRKLILPPTGQHGFGLNLLRTWSRSAEKAATTRAENARKYSSLLIQTETSASPNSMQKGEYCSMASVSASFSCSSMFDESEWSCLHIQPSNPPQETILMKVILVLSFPPSPFDVHSHPPTEKWSISCPLPPTRISSYLPCIILCARQRLEGDLLARYLRFAETEAAVEEVRGRLAATLSSVQDTLRAGGGD